VNKIEWSLTATTAISHSSLNPVPAEFTPTNRYLCKSSFHIALTSPSGLSRLSQGKRFTYSSFFPCLLSLGRDGPHWFAHFITCGRDNNSWRSSLWNCLHLLWFLTLRSGHPPQQSVLNLFFLIYRYFRRTLNCFQNNLILPSPEQH
jgi:hypothetical protein